MSRCVESHHPVPLFFQTGIGWFLWWYGRQNACLKTNFVGFQTGILIEGDNRLISVLFAVKLNRQAVGVGDKEKRLVGVFVYAYRFAVHAGGA